MTMLNLDELLDQDLSNVQAAPNYITPEESILDLEVVDAKGDKKTRANPEPGQDKEYIVLLLTYAIDGVVEQKEGTMPMAPGSLFSDQFQYNEKGLPFFKSRVLDIIKANSPEDVEAASVAKVSELLSGIKGMKFRAAVKRRVSKGKEGNEMINIRLEGISPVGGQ